VTATVYGWLGWLTFNREQYAVLSGRRAYYRNLKRPRRSHVELRRNVHRLEKGLLMRPAREVFAKDFIVETIEFYAKALDRPDTSRLDRGEVEWAHDVLARYFTVTSTTEPVIAKARAAFEALSVPASRGPSTRTRVAAQEAGRLLWPDARACGERRSVRWFLDKPVPRDLIDKALASPVSPLRLQSPPYEFLIFDDPRR